MEIKFKNVCYTYDKIEKNSFSLNDLNFTLESNKITSIIGPNGSGKTTILRLIESIVKPNSGIIKVGRYIVGKDSEVDSLADYKIRIGMVFQNSDEQFMESNGKDELELGLKFYNYRLKEINKRVTEALQMVGLDEEYLNKNIFELSKQEKKLISIASVLIFNPKVILLDEPTNGLDEQSKNKILKILKMLKNKYNRTIVISSHDTDFVLKASDNILVINDGKIILSGEKYDVFKQCDILKKCGIKIPKTIEFSDRVYSLKNIKIGYRDEVNDLLKDIYRYVK